MKNLMLKERKLAASPLSYLFLAFAAMTLIPGYPILVGAMFVCLGLFYSFQAARENNDILYSVLLPIPKADTVRAKFAFCCRIELAGFAIMAVLTVLRMTVLSNTGPYVTNVMMPANPVYLAFVLLIFTAFNRLFLRGFFQTGYGIGRPFVSFLIADLLLVGIGETLHHLPWFAVLKDTDTRALLIQCGILALAAGIYALLTLGAYRKRAPVERPFQVAEARAVDQNQRIAGRALVIIRHRGLPVFSGRSGRPWGCRARRRGRSGAPPPRFRHRCQEAFRGRSDRL